MNTKDLKLQIRTELNDALQAEYPDYTVYLGTTSETDNFITIDLDIYDQAYGRMTGQAVCNLAFSNLTELLDIEDLVINTLNNWTYANSNSGASLTFVIRNDLSNYAEIKHDVELAFEFLAY